MTARRRFVVTAAAWAALVTGLLIGVPVLARDRLPDAIERAWVEDVEPARVGGWGYRAHPGGTTIMIRRGDCLVVRLRSGRTLGVSVDDGQRGAALLNALVAQRGVP